MLQPLPYHRAVRDHLREHAAAAWARFSSDELQTQHAEELDLALLKATYRLDPDKHAALYDTARQVAEALGVEVKIELFQGPSDGQLNAALFFAPGSARVVLYGPLEERLEADELRALLGHELAHHLLWTTDRGELFTAHRALELMSGMDGAPSVVETARMFQLATETFADRGALVASGSVDAVVRCLLKTETELRDVDAASFLAQADEARALAGDGSGGAQHPETYLRAKAIALYADQGDDVEPAVQRLLEGALELDVLDLLRRRELAELTRDLVDLVLQPTWFRTDPVLGHARLLFDDYEVASPARGPEQIAEALASYGSTVLDFLSFVLVDFVALDPDLDELPLAHAQGLAEPLGLLERLEKHVNRELKIRKRDIESVRARRQAILDAAEPSPEAEAT